MLHLFNLISSDDVITSWIFCVCVLTLVKLCYLQPSQTHFILPPPVTPSRVVILEVAEAKLPGDDPECCCICMDAIETNRVELRCTHVFHFNCLREWLRVKLLCPLCKQSCCSLQVSMPAID